MRVVPAHGIHGIPGGQLAGQNFARAYAGGVHLPECLRLGRRGEILQVAPIEGTVTCTVKPGTPIFVFGFGTACSDVEQGTPYFAEGEAAQRACARRQAQAEVLAVYVTVDRGDGGERVCIRSERFEVTSSQMTAVLPEDNFFGKPAGTKAHLVADVYAAAIRGLTPGRHTILIEVDTIFGSFAGTTIVNVVPGA